MPRVVIGEYFIVSAEWLREGIVHMSKGQAKPRVFRLQVYSSGKAGPRCGQFGSTVLATPDRDLAFG